MAAQKTNVNGRIIGHPGEMLFARQRTKDPYNSIYVHTYIARFFGKGWARTLGALPMNIVIFL